MHGIEILLVDDDHASADRLRARLEAEGYGIVSCFNQAEALNRLQEREFDLVIIDVKRPGIDPFVLLEQTKETSPSTETIIISAAATVETAVQAIKKGAFHYLTKPFELEEMIILVKNALEKRILRLELFELRGMVTDKPSTNELIGKSPKIQQLKKEIGRVAPLDCTVLIRGETGTGKELVARIIHRTSTRADRDFLAVNCGTLNEEILSNELFGHEKEAFTGAQKAKKGVFEAISGGTLLLDEIGDMPMAMQVQLLRVLQEKTVIRVGGTREIPVDVRVLAATNRSLNEEIAKGTFRQDLYYRLNVFTLRLPPLRERRDDLPLFCRYFLDKYALEFGKPVEYLSDEAMERIYSYPFPGNVRELENVIERAVVLADGPAVTAEHLPRRLQKKRSVLFEQKTEDHFLTLEELEQQYIRDVLELTRYNKTRAAKILGIDRVSLWRKLKKFGLEEDHIVT